MHVGHAIGDYAALQSFHKLLWQLMMLHSSTIASCNSRVIIIRLKLSFDQINLHFQIWRANSNQRIDVVIEVLITTKNTKYVQRTPNSFTCRMMNHQNYGIQITYPTSDMLGELHLDNWNFDLQFALSLFMHLTPHCMQIICIIYYSGELQSGSHFQSSNSTMTEKHIQPFLSNHTIPTSETDMKKNEFCPLSSNSLLNHCLIWAFLINERNWKSNRLISQNGMLSVIHGLVI